MYHSFCGDTATEDGRTIKTAKVEITRMVIALSEFPDAAAAAWLPRRQRHRQWQKVTLMRQQMYSTAILSFREWMIRSSVQFKLKLCKVNSILKRIDLISELQAKQNKEENI